MKEINLTPKATADLEAIWLYSEIKFGVVKADEYIGRFSDIFDVLAAHEIGTRRLELGDHIFSLPVEKHVIFLSLAIKLSRFSVFSTNHRMSYDTSHGSSSGRYPPLDFAVNSVILT